MRTKYTFINKNDFQISGIRTMVNGIIIEIHCNSCDYFFEVTQPTVAGIGFSKVKCPICNVVFKVYPEDIIEIIDQHFSSLTIDEMAKLTKESTRIAESWYKNRLNEIVQFKGVNLGAPTERELLSIIMNGLYSIMLSNRKEK